jgi:hypothetical protein
MANPQLGKGVNRKIHDTDDTIEKPLVQVWDVNHANLLTSTSELSLATRSAHGAGGSCQWGTQQESRYSRKLHFFS